MDTPILAQRNPAATTLEDAYTVPTGKWATISSVSICNRNAAARTFRIALAPNGDADDPVHYLFYDSNIDGNKTVTAVLGLTLPEATVVRVYDSAADLTFTICGAENENGS